MSITIEAGCLHSSRQKQAADWFAAVSARATHFVAEIALGPWRLASCIPVLENRHGVVVTQIEPANQTTAHFERMKVSMLSGNCWRDGDEIVAGAVNRLSVEIGGNVPRRLLTTPRASGRREVRGRVSDHAIAILDSDQVWHSPLVIEKSGEPCCLCAWCGGQIRAQLVRKHPLDRFDGVSREPKSSPEDVHALR